MHSPALVPRGSYRFLACSDWLPCFCVLRCMQEVLSSFGMYTEYKWVWAGLAFMAGTYLLFGATVCAAFAITPVSFAGPGVLSRRV